MEKKNPVKQGRLDYILTSEKFSNIIENFDIKHVYRSDHSLVVVELKFNTFERGRGLWKFNNNLLHDREYVEKVKQKIHQIKVQYFQSLNGAEFAQVDDAVFFDVLLMEIRGMTISYSSFKKREKDQLEKSLIKEIESLEENSTGFDPSILEEKQNMLENLRKEKLKGNMIRSKARWVEEGEKPTKYFCHLESRNYLNKTIKKSKFQKKV